MNILPIIFAFILIFSFLTSSVMHEANHCIVSEKALKGLHLTSRFASNAVAKKRYNRIKPPPSSPKLSQEHPLPSVSPTNKVRKTYTSPRVAFPPFENSKFNLLPLLELKTEPKNHILYEICASLFRELYKDSLFKQIKRDGLEYDLLNAILTTCRTKNTIKTLSDLYPQEAHLRRLFYKMLKGTNQYDLSIKQGIARLEDFFTLNKGPVIYFSCASIPLLHALFGEKTTSKILSEEKQKYAKGEKKIALTQDELTALLSHDPARSSTILELDKHMTFSHKHMKQSTICKKNTQNGLIVQKKI